MTLKALQPVGVPIKRGFQHGVNCQSHQELISSGASLPIPQRRHEDFTSTAVGGWAEVEGGDSWIQRCLTLPHGLEAEDAAVDQQRWKKKTAVKRFSRKRTVGIRFQVGMVKSRGEEQVKTAG